MNNSNSVISFVETTKRSSISDTDVYLNNSFWNLKRHVHPYTNVWNYLSRYIFILSPVILIRLVCHSSTRLFELAEFFWVSVHFSPVRVLIIIRVVHSGLLVPRVLPRPASNILIQLSLFWIEYMPTFPHFSTFCSVPFIVFVTHSRCHFQTTILPHCPHSMSIKMFIRIPV